MRESRPSRHPSGSAFNVVQTPRMAAYYPLQHAMMRYDDTGREQIDTRCVITMYLSISAT